jgi:taurine---2-oxoglutarate transaminase
MGHYVHGHPGLGPTALTEHNVDLDELVFHQWTVQGPRDVRTFVRGFGSYVIDDDGRHYLDFSSQLVFATLGRQHPRIVVAIKQQADELCTLAPSHASDVRGEAARLIVEIPPADSGTCCSQQAGLKPSSTRFGWPA